ncbi:ABC transporter ATP-binding protein [Sporomusa malonica]|uniref:Putative ABC transport system ATP-binding protein n=1 Tax=Sporomusa malonica TaxID=112901 RepID=A0A1W2BPG0_9FIRM|nr:ABC transporter ATP-binding protein [Sporomusa malonica]SMC74817.1 putative ABC transport system ATP-binding protein [Sporomusa malonica]
MLELNQVRKDYRDQSQTVTAVVIDKLCVKAGAQLALVGPSGSGKTTLLHLISGLLTPTSGEIIFAGTNISGMSERWRDSWRATTVGYVFQRLNLLPSLNIVDNLLLPMSFAGVIPEQERRQWAIKLLGIVGLADRINSRPQRLSMGEQQRVAIARAIVNKPRLILADEPTASLDHDNSILVIELLRQLAQENNSILLVATHDRQVIDQFPQVYSLGRTEGKVNTGAVCGSLA